jgi:hypothetical protein
MQSVRSLPPRVTGVVEHFSRHRISGWARVLDVDDSCKFSVISKFKTMSIETSEFRARADWNGDKCGFVLVLPAELLRLSIKDFVDNFIGVFGRIERNGSFTDFPLPFFKDAALTFHLAERVLQTRKPGRRLCILIRTHLNSDKARHLAQSLEELADVDVYACTDVSNSPARVGNVKAIEHSAASLAEKGLWSATLPGGLFYYGDMPFYEALFAQPAYDFYLMVEYDVHFTEKGVSWLRRLLDFVADEKNPCPDLFAPSVRRAPEAWYWHAHAKDIYQDDEIWYCEFPIVGLSKAAIAFLYSVRLQESAVASKLQYADLTQQRSNGLAYCEYFVPTNLMKSGRFDVQSAKSLGLEWTGEIFRDFRIKIPILFGTQSSDDSALQHPVLDWPQYKSKIRHFLTTAATDSDETWKIILNFASRLSSEQKEDSDIKRLLELGMQRGERVGSALPLTA